MKAMTPVAAAQCFKSACLEELEALKPGNVHVFADGHGMTVEDFLRSAEAAAGPIAATHDGVGERILSAIRASHQAVGCNTNLGIVLLCAPMVHAALLDGSLPFGQRLHQVLQNLTTQDAALAFEAILIAAPAGLGQSERHDVHDAPHVSLLVAMQEAAERDCVARQYANGYRDIFAALDYYHRLLARWARPAWATTGLYLHFLASYPDSHIVRKYGMERALQTSELAARHASDFDACENPKNYLPALRKFDSALKENGINPGTSADMTVAALFLDKLLKIDATEQA